MAGANAVEASFEEKVTFQLSIYANLLVGRTGAGLEAHLRERIQYWLDRNREVIGSWDIVWGPAIMQFHSDLYAVNAAYVARSAQDPERYVVAVAGTNSASPFDWIVEDMFVQIQVPWLTRPDAGLSLGTSVGLNILKRIAPSGDRPGAGATLRGWLKGLPDKDVTLTVTGHSLGGALAPALALWLRDTQIMWDARQRARIATLATGGPTLGNPAFARYLDSRVAVTRYANGLDTVPMAWNVRTLEQAKDLYSEHGLSNPVPWLFDLAKEWSKAGGEYQHIAADASPIPATFNADLVDPDKPDCANFAQQFGFQHEQVYTDFFHLDGVRTPEIIHPIGEIIWTPGLRRIFETTGHDLPAELRAVPARTGSRTVPVGANVVALPETSDEAAAADLATRVAAELQTVAD